MAAQLAVYLRKNDVDAVVISTYPRQNHVYERRMEAEGVPVYYLNKRSGRDIKALWNLGRLLMKLKPDIIHGHLYGTIYALPWAIIYRKPLVRTIHTRPDNESKLRKLYHVWTRLGVIFPVTISPSNQEEACQLYHATPDMYPCIVNPVEIERFSRREQPAEDRMNFICVGRLDDNKNQILAVRAMPEVLKQIPFAKLMLVGDGEERESLIREAERLGVSYAVEFTGNVPDPEAYLARSDVYLMVSHVEGLPLSVLEAMAAGLPIIGTKAGSVVDIVKENGVLIEVDDLDALIREMIRFGKDETLRSRCGAISRKMARGYDADTCAKSYIRLYEDILRKKRKQGRYKA